MGVDAGEGSRRMIPIPESDALSGMDGFLRLQHVQSIRRSQGAPNDILYKRIRTLNHTLSNLTR